MHGFVWRRDWSAPLLVPTLALGLALVAVAGCRREEGGVGSSARDLAIARLEVRVDVLQTENRRLADRVSVLERGEGAAGGGSPRSLPDTAAVARPAIDTRCTQTKTGYAMSAAAFDEAIGQAGAATEARVVPNFQDGQATGFKLFSIRPDSLFASCGIRNGDVINTVNGMAINSPDMALTAYAKLKDAERIDLAITRSGEPATIRIDLTR